MEQENSDQPAFSSVAGATQYRGLLNGENVSYLVGVLDLDEPQILCSYNPALLHDTGYTSRYGCLPTDQVKQVLGINLPTNGPNPTFKGAFTILNTHYVGLGPERFTRFMTEKFMKDKLAKILFGIDIPPYSYMDILTGKAGYLGIPKRMGSKPTRDDIKTINPYDREHNPLAWPRFKLVYPNHSSDVCVEPIMPGFYDWAKYNGTKYFMFEIPKDTNNTDRSEDQMESVCFDKNLQQQLPRCY